MPSKSTSANIAHVRIPLVAAAFSFVIDAVIRLKQPFDVSGLPHADWPQLIPAGLGLACLIWSLINLIRQSEKPIDTIDECLSHLKQPAIIVNQNGIIYSLNQAAADLIHLAPEVLIGRAVHDLFHPESSVKDCLLCQRIRDYQELAATDFQFSQNSWRHISLSRISTVRPDQLLELHFDITSLNQIKQQMALAIDGAELGYWDWNYVTGKHDVNHHWLDMLGLEAEELDNYVSDWENRIHPEDKVRVKTLIAKHIASGTPYEVEFRMQHKKGHWVWIQGSGSVVEYDPASGQPTRLCGTHQNITTRKQFQQNLQAAYQVISQSPSVALKWQNAPGLPIEFATDNVMQLLGYSPDQLLSNPLLYEDLIHPDDLAIFRESLNNCSQSAHFQDIAHAPYRIISATGNIKWVQDHKVVSHNEKGQVSGYQGMVTDITRQRQQNRAIHNIISSSLEKTANSTLDNLTLLASEALGAQYTVIAEIHQESTCKTLSFCAHGNLVDNIEYDIRNTPCANVVNGNIVCYPQNVTGKFPNDEWLSQHGIEGYVGIPLLNEQNLVPGFVVALYCQPIPDPQFAEDLLRLFATLINSEIKRSRALQAMELQQQRLIDAQSISHIGDWHWHWSDNHFSWSGEMYRITGTQRSSFIPSFASFLTQLVHPDDRNFFKVQLQNSHTNEDIDFKHRIVLGDGEIRHVHQRGKLIRDSKHRATGIQGTMQDITERLKTEQHLLEAKLEAEKATQVKSEFLANMSHEIRTPMNAIVGLVELCLNSSITSKQRDYLERVETAAHGLMRLIDDILDFSRMESGKLHLDTLPFLLEEMLDQVFSTMEELCRRKNLKLIRPSIHQGMHAVVGDPQRLRQILINLIGNAIKFTEHGQIEVTLTELKRTPEHTTLEFSIIDTGIGMNEAQQTRLFKAFSQGDSSVTRTYGGTGLGLVISKQLIEQMDGTIRVDSQEQVGSCFSFTVRLGISDLETVRKYQHHPRKEVNSRQLQNLQGAHLLLVEDNEVNRIVAIELLTQAQLSVDTAENGEVALLKLKQNAYDCVLMDVQMPKMDGYETTRNLRKLPECADLPVIAMTANVMSVDRQKCQQAGMNDFIGKPILPEILYSVLIKWIKPRHPQNMHHAQTFESIDIPFMYGIDSAIGLEHTAGDKRIYRKILQKFAENHADSMNEITQALADQNSPVVNQQVHTLKGLAGSLGALSLQNNLQRLEESLAQNNSNTQNTQTIARLIATTTQELQRVINSIQSTLPLIEPVVELKPRLSLSDIKQELQVLLTKLQAFDSDADQQLDLILGGVEDQSLMNELLLIRKQIANYQFVDAAQSLMPLLDFPIR